MSIISAAFTENEFHIVTDTLQARHNSEGKTPFPGIIVGFTSKIVHYPHLKCCVVTLGSSKLSYDHDCFVGSNFFEDIVDLYNATADDFFDGVEPADYPGDDNLIAAIMIFGYSELEKKMVILRVDVSRDGIKRSSRTKINPVEDGLTTFMSPRLKAEDEQAIGDKVMASGAGVKEFLLEVAKKMHRNSLDPETYVFPVGGELNYTRIGLSDGSFYSVNTIEHRFADYNEQTGKIKEFRRNLETAREYRENIKQYEDAIAWIDKISGK